MANQITVPEALISLHEQAHGTDSIRYCMHEPCRSLPEGYRQAGPAPHSITETPAR